MDIILNPNYRYEGHTLLSLVLSHPWGYDDERELIPVLRRIKETGRKLSPKEQESYDQIKEDNEKYEWFNGVF